MRRRSALHNLFTHQGGFAWLVPLVIAGAIGVGALVLHAVHSTNPTTAVAALADVVTKLQASGNVILKSADTAAKTPNPLNPGTTLLTVRQVDVVAINVYKLGRAGKRLKKGLDDYSAVKAAGGDLNAQRAAIQQAVADASDALHEVGVAVPSGTVAAIDAAVADALGIIAAFRAGGLQ